MRLTFSDAQRNVAEIANRESYNFDVIFELLAAYGRSASAITKLRTGILNLAQDKDSEVLQRGVVYFKHVPEGNLLSVVDSLDKDPLVVRYNPRYLIATDYDQLVAKDTKKDTTLDIKLRDIDRNVDFFYGWTGDEITSEKTEAVADRRAADRMQELYSEIEKVNAERLADAGSNFRHDLNVFFSRLLFCFFAEDTRVFSREEKSLFTGSIKDYTQTDGSDLDVFLETLFKALDTEDKAGLTSPYSKFPYVNGTIFDTKKHSIGIPKFNAQARKLILDCGNLNWSEINPDIFGSMFQSIVDETQRHTHGQHYTSVPNIMKTIEPLFLDELREEFDKYYDNPKKLVQLWKRISEIKIFDPACGSGNFLIIAYKELRKIEHAIIERLFVGSLLEEGMRNRITSKIKLDNFYGIEIDDFPHEIAILSLYLAKHQMNIEFEQQFGREIKLIPLKDNANIVHGNAARLDWNDVCPNAPRAVGIADAANQQSSLIGFEDEDEQQELAKEEYDEIYLIGNPPYLGQRNQKDSHKDDLSHVFDGDDGKYKKMDYVCIWFSKGADYISNTPAKLAFVSTNSVTQGVQIEQLWPRIFSTGCEVSYAYRPFRWTNNAKDSAGVYCVVISLVHTNFGVKNKYIIDGSVRSLVNNINPYIVDGDNVIINKEKVSISGFAKMVGGCQPREGGYLMLTGVQKEEMLSVDSRTERFILPMVGSSELLEGSDKWCIWIDDDELEDAMSIPAIKERIERVRQHRVSGNTVEKTFSKVPHKFVTTRRPKFSQIIIPAVSTSSRDYIPIGYLNRDTIVNSRAYCIFDAPIYYFAILSSRMHNIWINTVSGRLGNAINYSSNICYNAFPMRPLLEHEIQELNAKARNVLFVRENHSEKTLAEMYDPDKMPDDLREAHAELDLAVDRLYRQKPYSSDEERLADLFALYEQMTASEKVKN